MPNLSDVTSEQWSNLSQRTIYFGHQSVGANIIEGVRELAAEYPQIRLRIVSGESPSSGPVLSEFPIGNNGEPDSKNAAFLAATQRALGPKPTLMFKYCYVDVDENTDTKTLFNHYQQTVAALRVRHPEAVVVHITLPLVKESSLARYYLNRLRGLSTTRSENAKRNQYNEMLHTAFDGKEPIFDLAVLESTHADGGREYTTLAGRPVYALAPEWTTDGGHLNAMGRRRVAEQLLVILATLPNAEAPALHPKD
jgi:lysophospholipase L1-like esterase